MKLSPSTPPPHFVLPTCFGLWVSDVAARSIWIAATALTAGARLWTLNVEDFADVPELILVE